jgi:phenylacetate-CoA ligase
MIRAGENHRIEFYDRDLETLDREKIGELQDLKISALANSIKANRFYGEKAESAGMSLEDLRDREDLRRLPFTTKAELVLEQASHPPFGRLPTWELWQYRYFHQTSGTTGRPLRWLDTAECWEWWAHCWGFVYRAAGVTERDVVFCAFSFGPYLSHWAGISGVWHVGAMAISGGGMSSEQRLQSIIDNECTVIVCTPTYALHLAEVARRSNIDLRRSAVRIGIHAGEPGASLPNVKSAIEDAWGITCFDHAGSTESGAWAYDCQAQTGAIHLNEAEFVFEVIDPSTLEPATDGARGELVVTNLGRAGMPLLRYRSGDLVELTAEPCRCGRTFSRIRGGVLGRADDMIIVRGVNLYPAAIDDLIRSLRVVIEYEVEIRRVEGLDELLIKIEPVTEGDSAAASQAISQAFRRHFNIRVACVSVGAGTLPRYEFKSRRFKRV